MVRRVEGVETCTDELKLNDGINELVYALQYDYEDPLAGYQASAVNAW